MKCQKWGVTTADVNNVVTSAVAAKALSTMVEGEKRFDIAIRWPKWRRNDETSIMGDEGFIADAVSLGAARVEDGHATIDHVRIGRPRFRGQ